MAQNLNLYSRLYRNSVSSPVTPPSLSITCQISTGRDFRFPPCSFHPMVSCAGVVVDSSYKSRKGEKSVRKKFPLFFAKSIAVIISVSSRAIAVIVAVINSLAWFVACGAVVSVE